jgi:hypothetical protein
MTPLTMEGIQWDPGTPPSVAVPTAVPTLEGIQGVGSLLPASIQPAYYGIAGGTLAHFWRDFLRGLRTCPLCVPLPVLGGNVPFVPFMSPLRTST